MLSPPSGFDPVFLTSFEYFGSCPVPDTFFGEGPTPFFASQLHRGAGRLYALCDSDRPFNEEPGSTRGRALAAGGSPARDMSVAKRDELISYSLDCQARDKQRITQTLAT